MSVFAEAVVERGESAAHIHKRRHGPSEWAGGTD